MIENGINILPSLEVLGKHLRTSLDGRGRVFILADHNTAEHCLPLIQEMLPEQGKNSMLMDLAPGEDSKNLETASQLYSQLMDYGAQRNSVLLNLGGGMVCDMGGFVASTYKRGMDFIHIPTTVLAQVDAAVGGKTGVNHGSVKNMVGTFVHPMETLVCSDFLNTLPKREVMAGFAEMIKHGLIADQDLWRQMRDNEYIDLPLIRSLIPQALNVKQEIVKLDFLEKGDRKKLNFGHTIGHALESLFLDIDGEHLLHGEAVAWGMLCESHLSMLCGLLTEQDRDSICGFIGQHYPVIKLEREHYHRVIELMRHDKKNKDSRINFTLLSGIGESVIDQEPQMEHIMESLDYLERYSQTA